MSEQRNEGKAASKPSQGPKDLITLMNVRNGEVYKFACKTCIDGHRAPLCDPHKHRGKIMFRRPAPGRPARQCGHPKSAQCDCLAKRTLCCILSNDQWDQVEQGAQVAVQMYDCREDLEAAQRAMAPDASTPDRFRESSVSTYMSDYNYPIAGHRIIPQFQTLDMSGPQGLQSKAVPNSYLWAAPDAAALTEQSSFTPILPPSMAPMPVHNPYQHVDPLAPTRMHGTQQFDAQTVNPTAPWLQARPEYLPFNSARGPESQFAGVKVEKDVFGSDYHAIPVQQPMLTAPSSFRPVAPPASDTFYARPPASMLHEFALDSSISDPTQFDPSQPPGPGQSLSQSCCSSKRAPPQQTHVFQNFQFPGRAPTAQFPCPNCASTQCTCLHCPEVMQDIHSNGAWAQACGRAGHLDSNSFVAPQPHTSISVQMQQQREAMAPPMGPQSVSCCSSKAGTASQSPAFNQSQAVPDISPWAVGQQPPEVQSSESSGQVFPNNVTVDPTMLYQRLPDWHNMR